MNILGAAIQIKEQGAKKAAEDVSKGLDKLKKSAGGASSGLKDLEKRQNTIDTGFKKMATNILAAGTAFLSIRAGVGLIRDSINLYADFQQQMLGVKAISGATEEQYKTLTDKARELGATTQFSASQAAEGMKNLAKAGFQVNEILDAMPGLLNLSAAGEVDLATSSKIVAQNIRAFGLQASQSMKVADLFAKTATTTNTDIIGLGESLKNVSASSAQMGQTLGTTLAILGKMGDKAIENGEAGTALNAVLSTFNKRNKNSKIAVAGVNIALGDQQGKFRDLFDILGDIERATKNMTETQRGAALAKVFDTRAAKGINVALSTGIQNLRDYRKELDASDGTSKRIADTMNSGVKGAMKQFNSAWEELKLIIGETFAPAFLSSLTSVMDKMSEFAKNIKLITDNAGYIEKTFAKSDTGLAGVVNRAAGTTTPETALTESTGFFDYIKRSISGSFAAQKRLFNEDRFKSKPDRKMQGGGTVQRDGVVAELHKGEEVIPRQKVGKKQASITIINNFSAGMNEDMIIDKMVRKLELAMENV